MPSLRRLLLPLVVFTAACATPPAPAPTPAPAPSRTIAPADVSALTELMQLEDTRTYDAAALQRLAASSSDLIRSRTMLAAGRIGNRAATDLLLRGLTDPSDSVKAYAAFALGELGDSAAHITQGLGALTLGAGAPAREAIAALGKIGGSNARPLVENVFKLRRAGLEVGEALLAVWRFPRTPESAALIRGFAASADNDIRWRATYALVRGGADPANVSLFQQLARDPSPLVRSLAVRGLRAATVDSANARATSAPILLNALAETDEQVRINAVGILGGYRDVGHAARAARLLRDPRPNVRVAAIQALSLMKGPDAIAALEAKASEAGERAAIRGFALAALATVDAARALPAARTFAAQPDVMMRLYATRAFGNIRQAAAIESLYALASDRDVRVRAAAVAAVANIAGDTLLSARAFFMENLGAAPAYVRAAALEGLQRLAQPGDEAVVLEAFEGALRDSIEDAGVAAAAVLGRLARNNPAIARSFAARFSMDRIPLHEVQRAAIRELHLDATCCALSARPDVYRRVVTTLLVPALEGRVRPRARVTTEGGSFEFELLATDAPLTVDNFVALARRRYFDNGRWHRVVPNFVLQDGDPTGTGSGGPGYAIRDEINRFRYGRGTVGMALSGPDTGGSQWFVTHSPQPHLDGGYTVFGQVVAGMEVADGVVQDDPIMSIEIIQ